MGDKNVSVEIVKECVGDCNNNWRSCDAGVGTRVGLYAGGVAKWRKKS